MTRLALENHDVNVLLSASELAQLLSVSLRHIRKMNTEGKLPKPIYLGHSVRWSLKDIESWISAGAPKRNQWESRKEA